MQNGAHNKQRQQNKAHENKQKYRGNKALSFSIKINPTKYSQKSKVRWTNISIFTMFDLEN